MARRVLYGSATQKDITTMSKPEEFSTIDEADLGDVTGGATTRSTGTSGSNDQVTAALQAITSSLSSLKNNNANSGTGIQSLLPMLLLAKGGGGGACPSGCCPKR